MMIRIFSLLLPIAVLLLTANAPAAPREELGGLVFDHVPQAPPEAAQKIDAYLNSREATPLSWSPKGLLMVRTRFGEVDQLHVLEAPVGTRRQVTFFSDPILRASFSPDPASDAFFFLKDARGDEKMQLYYQRLSEPSARMLTDGKSVNGSPVWSNAGHEIAFLSTARDGATIDIDIVDPQARSLPRLAVAGDGAAWRALDWSPDDRKLLVLKSVSSSETTLYVVDLASGEKREVEPSPTPVGIRDARFSRDGQGVYLISDRDGEFAQLRYVNLFTGEKMPISSHIPWDIEELAISRDGHYLAYVSNEGGAGKLNLLDLRNRQDLVPPRLPSQGTIGSLSFDFQSKRLAFGYGAPNMPRDAYVLDLESNHLEAWTHSEVGPVDLLKFVTPRLTHFPTFDRDAGHLRDIPIYVFEPPTPGPHPVLILFAGAPDGQFRPSFDPWIQFVVAELGYAVIAPNLRGSSGYGKSYSMLDNGMLRDDVVKDVGALLVWLEAQSAFDAKRVVVSGRAYGGFLTLAALANFGDRLRGGVAMGGISDFVGYLGSTAPYRQRFRRAQYGDERDPDVRAFLRRISPLTAVERISKPVLIVHGQNDPYVPISEAEQMVFQLRNRGTEVWYLHADDEGNVFRKKHDRDAYWRTFAQFLSALP